VFADYKIFRMVCLVAGFCVGVAVFWLSQDWLRGKVLFAFVLFFLPVWLWRKRFSPHAQHGCMQAGLGFVCEGMNRLVFSCTRVNESNELCNAVGRWHGSFGTSPSYRYKRFGIEKAH
jgi:hypothetical protein